MSDRKITVLAEHDEAYMRDIAAKLDLPLCREHDEISSSAEFYFSLNKDVLSLTNLTTEENVLINVDFLSGSSTHRREYGGGKSQALGRAIGLNKKANLYVLDATAGLGKDAFVMACLGCRVKMVEKSPIVGVLLEDGLKRAACDDNVARVVQNMSLVISDSIEYMRSDSVLHHPPDVVYLDPMYPERKKSAKVKKEMQTLQQLLRQQDDLDSLLDAASGCALKRVVVKRPKGAQALTRRQASHTIQSKKTRYDVYMSN